jgi:hypothetical protein
MKPVKATLFHGANADRTAEINRPRAGVGAAALRVTLAVGERLAGVPRVAIEPRGMETDVMSWAKSGWQRRTTVRTFPKP